MFLLCVSLCVTESVLGLNLSLLPTSDGREVFCEFIVSDNFLMHFFFPMFLVGFSTLLYHLVSSYCCCCCCGTDVSERRQRASTQIDIVFWTKSFLEVKCLFSLTGCPLLMCFIVLCCFDFSQRFTLETYLVCLRPWINWCYVIQLKLWLWKMKLISVMKLMLWQHSEESYLQWVRSQPDGAMFLRSAASSNLNTKQWISHSLWMHFLTTPLGHFKDISLYSDCVSAATSGRIQTWWSFPLWTQHTSVLCLGLDKTTGEWETNTSLNKNYLFCSWKTKQVNLQRGMFLAKRYNKYMKHCLRSFRIKDS